MNQNERKYLWLEPFVAWSVWLLLLISYWLTVAPTVSFWDCPEYVSAAWGLEVGHPPGNPTWMLVERIVTLFAPSGQYAAIAVNLSSGLFTAFASFFLAKTLFRAGLWVLLKLPRRRMPAPVGAAGAAAVAALSFGWCDSTWFSAVEAEVYAMSIFLTALCVWLMTKWAGTKSRQESWRLLILLAYIFGLSIGVHQLNLLCIPPLAMIWAFRRGIRSAGRLMLILLLSFIVVACVLLAMMPSTIALAARCELFAVCTLGLPKLSGVVIYLLLLGISLIGAIVATTFGRNRGVMAAACWPAIFLSGIFVVKEQFAAGAVVSLLVAYILVRGHNFEARRLSLAIWMLTMLLVGYSSYALIPVRGDIPAPANPSMPGNPFSFATYQSREQYGSAPLFYGRTPYSKPLFYEDFDSLGKPSYRRYANVELHDVVVSTDDGYLIQGKKLQHRLTPELDIFFPRIHSADPSHLAAYAKWIGMDTTTMTRVEISEAIDSLGRPVARLDSDGNRTHPHSFRPTPLQNLQWFATYQTAYMYWRYLLWNFSGRQNDVASTGEVQHGNFITGFDAIDTAMLGDQQNLPSHIGMENPGRNRYFLLPLLLGIIGIVWLLKSRRRGIELCMVIAMLFIMTGLAITIYLNQTPGEPRERDYSFLGSYWAFAAWIGFGSLAIARLFRSAWGFAIGLAVAGWLCVENFDDHDRSNRYAARNLTINIMQSMEPDAIIFVAADNLTFPLWYLQEVEEMRTDVRVLNMAYLGSAPYAANSLRPWREAPAVPATLRRENILSSAFASVKVPASGRDTLPAVEALRALREEKEKPSFPSRYVWLPVSKDSTILFDLRSIAPSGSMRLATLMLFDIVATNAYAPKPRPIYWLHALGSDGTLGLTPYTSPWIFGTRFGLADETQADSALMAQAVALIPPNPLDKNVYMDHTPAFQITQQRAAVTAAAERMLRRGNVEGAAKLALIADTLFGNHPDTYGRTRIYNESYDVRKHLGELLLDISRAWPDTASSEAHNFATRGRHHLNEHRHLQQDWQNYRQALPPRLRNKM